MFAALHVKSEYSLGHGTATPTELVRRAAEYGYSALALTDVETLAGQVEFHHAARAYGLRAIGGVELRDEFVPGELGRAAGRLVLLARDAGGYASLCRLLTHRRAGRAGDNVRDCLAIDPTGLFYLSDDPTVLSSLLRAGVDPRDIRRLARGGDESPSPVRAVADPDVVLLDPNDRELQRLLVAVRTQQRLVDVPAAAAQWLPDPRSLRERFGERLLGESSRLADACTFDLGAVRAELPRWHPASGAAPADYLAALARERLAAGRAAGRWRDATYDLRLSHELAVVAELGFSAYFPLVCEITDHARSEDIEVAARGSAASSLLAHVLGITPIDPLVHGLYFERFLHPGRRELPDIDLDLPSDRRDAVIEWVLRRFGPERAARVSTVQRLAARSAARELARALDLRLPDDDDELPAALRAPPWRALLGRLIGKPHHLSVHPGGVVVAEPDLATYVPLERVPSGMVVTQYDMRSLARLGLVKIDLLGNRALSALADARRLAGEPDLAPGRDVLTWQRLRAADTIGCFQIETPPVRATLRKLPLRDLDDVMAALAVVRPGPASGGARAAYIRRARGEEPPVPPHPRLAAVLRDTHGMLVYDEDVIAALAAMTGWSLARADAVRTALIDDSADPAALSAVRREFLAAAAATGAAERDAAAVWELAARFAAYSFNKAHAAGYAHLAWRTAAMKSHHPAAFACGVLDHYGGHYPLRTIAADLARHGVRLLAPHVHHSTVATTLEAGAVRVGLSHVKHLTTASARQLLRARPFADFAALLRAVPLGARELPALVLAGACDGLAPLDPDAYPLAHEALLARLEPDRSPERLRGLVVRAPVGPAADLYRRLVRVRNELACLHMHLSDHPLRILRGEAERAGCVPTPALTACTGREVRVVGLIAASRRHRGARGRVMQFVTLEDEWGLVEAVISSAVYAALGDPIRNPGPVMLTGRVEIDRGHPHIDVSQVQPFYRRARPFAGLLRG
ncbi:DNA polymerase-3 subunit alpha [Nannocystis exedens]|uniref:DNA-directed DNA polymerase n=1 Tax=Nannocystis exedens TaxID=54 RepID=A0A1I2CSF9_9BACT|nr:PHP domain-containing protein [Nannocystis exedens]PCC68504.1 DNA polymerase III subunit alpha [Nannocystis exedens]SFE70723.1 DNA polymerase-3 subunit alpha [Nannocystis exedens]